VHLRAAGRHARPAQRRVATEALIALTASSLAVVALTASAGLAAPTVTDELTASSTAAAAPVAPRVLDKASRSRDRAPIAAATDPLPDCPADAAAVHPNGQLPVEALCALPGPDGHKLRPDAARALVTLGAAYAAELGEPLCLTDSYRSLGSQQALAAKKPGLAARPGTSEHGWGLAVDVGCGAESYDTPENVWLVENAGRFGWGQPAWAQKGGARQEPWHWEYLAGQ
jgi:D-alanyl-D-alanine carboxypeptidase